MKIIFKDTSIGGQFVDNLSDYFGERDNIEYFYGDIQWLDVQGKALMSPESSFCNFGYGLEYCYSQEMFPGIEEKVQQQMKALNITTPDGRHYLPIGSAMMVPTQNETTYILASPTVFLSKDISNTRNAYKSFMAALCVFDKFKKSTNNESIDTIVCPGHLFSRLYKLPYEETAKQIWEAYHDFMSVKRPMEIGDKSDPYSYVSGIKNESH